MSLRRHHHFSGLGKRKQGKLPTLKRPLVICETCGREKRLDADGRLKPHSVPGTAAPGIAGTKCCGSTFRSAPLRRPATRTARIPAQNRKRAAEQRLADFGPQAEWMRDRYCAVCAASPPCEPAHVRSRGAGGTRDDMVPLCQRCHNEQHAIGTKEFDERTQRTVPGAPTLADLADEYAQRWADLLPQVRTQYELLFCQRWPAAGRLFRERGYS